MTSLNENISDLIVMLTKIPDICAEFQKSPSQESGEKIVEIIVNSEEKLLTVKQNVVIIVNDMKEEESFSVEVIPSNNGFIIKNDRE